MSLKRIKKVCVECGSEEVKFDTYAMWNFKTQQLEVVMVSDKGHFCENCEKECKIIDIEVEDDGGIN